MMGNEVTGLLRLFLSGKKMIHTFSEAEWSSEVLNVEF